MALLLALLFAVVALAYASVGFGGGSTYNALLALGGVQYALIPVIALACNLVVVSGSTARFAAAGRYNWQRDLPLLAVSVPAAFVGGIVPLSENLFFLLLGTALLCSAALMIFPYNARKSPANLPAANLPAYSILLLSGVVGFVAGMSGIGGGIFLAPLLHLTRWDSAKHIAAFASLYILANSISGLAGQIMKNGIGVANAATDYWPLLIAVLIGGQIGNHIGVKLFSEIWLRRATAALVAYVAVRLLWQSFAAM